MQLLMLPPTPSSTPSPTQILSPPPTPCSPTSLQSPCSSPREHPSRKKIIGSYELGKTLGKGSYSTVKRGYHVETRNEVAIKILTPTNKSDMDDIDREIAILKLLKHPNIIHLLDVINEEGSKKIYLVFELVNGGDLFDYTIARGRLSEREARRIMREVVSGVAYCHAHMVVHRDLKLENLLMDKDGHARIADFGMSGIMQPGLSMNTFCGSPMYMSPEIVRGLGYGPGVDIWSLGVVLYTILVGQTPWKLSTANSNTVEDIETMLAGQYTIPPHVKLSPECEELISLMIVPEHAKRASMEQIMVHPWLAEGYDHPVTVPMSIKPISEVNEVVVKRMLAMGYTEAQIRKAITEDFPSPARMVYHHMCQLMEDGLHEVPLIPALSRRRNSSTSPRTVSPRGTNTSPRSATTSPRRGLLDGPMRTRAISDSKRITFRRGSGDSFPTQPSSYSAPARGAFPLSALPIVPLSPRAALLSSWRLSQMSTISEEAPSSTKQVPENPSPRDPFNKNILPTLALNLDQHCNSAPCSPQSSPSSTTPSTLSPSSPSSPTSPTSLVTSPSAPTSPRPQQNLAGTNATARDGETQLVVVRGAFNVATTTLKPRKVLIAEISRVLDDAKITYALDLSVFKCKVDREERGEDKEKELKFDVEICRVAGLEMLLGVRFQRVVGKQWEYQEICKRLINSMKL